jgi:hypothetical protein
VALGLVLVVAACGPSRADEAGPATTTATTAEASTDVPGDVVRPTSGTLPAPGSAPASVELPTAAPSTTAAPVRLTPRPTTTVAEVPDPADAPPPDLRRDPNAGDQSSPYGPFGPFEVQTLGTDGQLQVTAAVDRYLDEAVLVPLQTGVTAQLADVLTATTLAALQPDQRAVLTEEGSPVVADAAVDQHTVTVDGIVAPDGSSVAVATVALAVAGTLDGTPVRSTRTGTLTFVLDGTSWRIDAFSLQVDRDLP